MCAHWEADGEMADKIVALRLSLLTSVKLCVFVLDHLVLSELVLAGLVMPGPDEHCIGMAPRRSTTCKCQYRCWLS
jgi:hypothetical protein